MDIEEVSVLEKRSLMKILADPVRLQILMLLMMNEMTGKQLSDKTRLSQPNIHRHLRILLDSKLIILARTQVKGNIIEKYYKTAISDQEFEASLTSKLKPKDKAAMAVSLAGALMALINHSVHIIEEQPKNIENYPIAVQINVLPTKNDTKTEVTKVVGDAGKKLQEIVRKHSVKNAEPKFVTLIVTLPYE
jgi:DNA-binding transcriptional ArsR family regulator